MRRRFRFPFARGLGCPYSGPISRPLPPTSKMDRGFEHDNTGCLLCPIDYNWEDPAVCAGICEGSPSFTVTADSWPAFLYPKARGSIKNIESSLFCSTILLKAFKFIFTSPSSTQDIECQEDVEEHTPSTRKGLRRNQKAPTHGHIVNLLGMKVVMPRSLAYVAVQPQLHFGLSNANAWNENDSCFSYVDFYNNILDYFEIPVGSESQSQMTSLLSWWTR
ncbi:hypothetical protein L208DRAFT_1293518 [Tricholoma matsutake]|nr:hypothetical protein L208DRAFT_1293518 [Tricholoma matsutake 945]